MAGSVELPALLAKIKIDDKEYKAGIGNVQTALDKLEQKMRATFSSMENIGKKAAIPFAALSATIGGVAKAAGDLETATIRLSAAVQGDTKELEFFTQAVKKVRAGSEETLTTITNVMARAKLLGTELGLSNDQIAELTLISENLSTIWGGDMQTALEGLMYGMAGMTRGLKQYGIFADDVRLKERLRAQGLSDDLSLLSATEKSQLIYETILESVAGQLTLANAAGASFNTQIARVKNAFIDLAAAVGKPFLQDFTKSITLFADKIIAISQSPALTELISRILRISVAVTGIGVAIGFAGKLGTISLTLLHTGFSMLTNPIVIVIAAIGLLLANLDKISGAWKAADIEDIGDYWSDLTKSLKGGDFGGVVDAGLKIAIAPVKWLWGGVETAYTALAGILGADVSDSITALKAEIENGNYFAALGFAFGVVANAIWEGIQWGLATAALIGANISKEWGEQKALIESEWNTGSKATASVLAVVFATWGGIRWVGEQFALVGATLSSVISEDWNTQITEVKNLWESKDYVAASIVAVASVTWQGLKWVGAQFVEVGTTLTSVINADWETQKAAVAVLWEGKNLIAATIVAGVTGTWQGIKWMFGAVELTAKTLSDVISEDVETQKKAVSDLWGSGKYIEAAIVAGVTGTWQGIKWAWGAAKTIYTSIVEILNLDWEEQKKAIGTLWGEGKYIEAAITAAVVGRWNGLKWAWGVATTTFETLADVINSDWEIQKAEIGSLWAAGEIVPALLVATVTGTWNGIKWISGQTKLAIDSIAAGVQVDWEEQKKIAAGLWAGKDFVAATISAIVFATFQGVKWIVGAIGNVGALIQKAFEESTLKTDIDAFKAQLGASGFSVETIEAAIDVIVGIGKIVVNVVANLWETVKNKIVVAIGLAENEETAKDVGSFEVLARVIVNIGNLVVSAVTYALDIVDNIIKAISNTIREAVFGGESGELDQPVNVGDIAIILTGVLRFASAGFSFATDFFTSMNAAVANAVKNLREENQKISIGIGVTFDVENEILTTEIHAFAGKVWEFFKSGFLLVANVGELVAEAFRNALIGFTGSPEIANIVTKISESLVFVVSLKLAADALSGVMATLSATLGLSKGVSGYILPVLITFGLSFLGDSVSRPMQEVKELKENLSTAIGANLFVPESFVREMSDFQKRLFAIMQYQGEPNFLTGIADRLLELSGESGFFAELEAGFDAALIYAYDFLERLGSMINNWVQDKIRNIPGIGEILVGKNPETTITAINAIEKIVSTGDKSQIAAIGELAASGAKIEEIAVAAEAITNLTIPTDLNRELNNALNSTTELYEQMEIISKTLFGMTVEQLADSLGENAIEVINRLEEYLRNEVFRDVYTLKIDADVTSIVAKLKALNIKNLPELKLSGKRFGGYTGAYPEDQVAGVVHGGEWVAPAWMLRRYPELFETLETARYRGYKDGGFVSQTIGLTSGAGSAIGTSLDAMKTVVDYISNTFLKIIQNLDGVLGEETANTLKMLVNSMQQYIGEMPELFKVGMQQLEEAGKLPEELKGLGNSIGQSFESFEDAAKGLGNATQGLENAAKTLKSEVETYGAGADDIASAVRSAFSANTYEEFVGNFSQSLEEMTKNALINAFLSSEVAKASMEKLSGLFVAAVKDGTISSEELSGIKAAEQELQGLMKNTWDVLAGLGYVNKPEEQTASTEKQDTAFTKFQNFLMEQAKKIFETIKNFVINPLKDGMSKVLSPAFKRLQEPLYRLGLMLGEILLPVVEALTPIFEALAIGLAYVINVIIGVANMVISLINLIPSVNIPTMNYIDIAKLKEGFSAGQGESEYSNETTAGWNQPITNNFTITFTGNTILDTDDRSLEVLSDALIRYWKDKGVKVFA